MVIPPLPKRQSQNHRLRFHPPRKYLLILMNYKKEKNGSQGKTSLWILGGLDAFFELLNPGGILDFRFSAAHGSVPEKKRPWKT
jgi:hypothetical protein